VPLPNVDHVDHLAAIGHPDYSHRHVWLCRSGQPLACEDCGEPWPGEPLPDPAHDVEPSGWHPDRVTWGARVRAMLAETDRQLEQDRRAA
jgi:hypothetical protein